MWPVIRMARCMLFILLMQILTGWTVATTPAPPPPTPAVRLVGSNRTCSGRVEVYLNDQWGTVCDDLWGERDAQVVCQELGCGSAVLALRNAYFGPGDGPIWLDNVQCSGNESSIINCEHRGAGTHNCGHYEDASVICEEIVPPPQPNPPVRLVDSNRTCSGRVEVYLHGYWGTVCDDHWGLTEAQVVCQELGCGSAVAALTSAQFGQGVGPIWLDDVQCSGDESSILNCGHQGAGSHNCGHYEDASVICEESVPTPPPNPPVRLVDSNSACSGRVEVYLHGHWGTVCDDRWGLTEAQVVCLEVGCGSAVLAPHRAQFGQGDGPIWLDDVQCSGNESSILNCGHRGAGTHNCRHFEDVGVVCEESDPPPPPSPPVRLVDSNSTCSGRVEVYLHGHWGTVCDDRWGLTEAQVVCQELGCGRALSAPQYAHFGEGNGPIWLDDVQCSGNESSILNCGHLGAGTHNCRHYEDASVVCEVATTLAPTVPTPTVRLVGSESTCAGRVEVYFNDQWGTVCDDYWGLTQAQVVCQELGCGSAVAALNRAQFGQGVGPIWLDNVQCSGNESSIINCGHLGAGTHNCGHYEDASVVCEEIVPTPPPPSPPVRLVDSNRTCSGRVEVYLHGHWGTVCDDRWGLTEAQVVCQELGCGNAVAVLHSAYFGQGVGLIWLDDVQCSGNESSILNCGHLGAGTHNCIHYEDVSVICEEIVPLPPPSPPVRLVGSNRTCSGRVEVYLHGYWGTVCDDMWGLTQAQVVCQELGCGNAVTALNRAQFGRGIGPIWLDDVQCSGNESSILNCGHLGAGTHNCGHYEDVSVICEGSVPPPPLPTPPVRLVDSNSTCSGRVEVYLHGHWGTVCDDRWGLTEAQVVCQELGCGNAVTALNRAQFGRGIGPIWLDDVQCSGNESSILNCGHLGAGTHNCGHYEDVSVICEGSVPPPPPPTPPVRLVDSNSTCSGRVEVYLHGHWGTVCDDRWGLTEAQVVCQELGCGRALSAPRYAHFGEGEGLIWLDDVQCSGNESSIFNCGHLGAGTHNCRHYEDASVVCEVATTLAPTVPTPTVRLVGSESTCAGRVEVYFNDQWGTVCDDYWGLTQAQVVCQELGCGSAVAALNRAQFGQGVGPIWLDNVQCSGNESSIINCGHLGAGTHNCGHYEDASVVCEEIVPTPPPPNPPVRLVDSNRTCSGRVEVYLHGHWGTVCDDRWGLTEAQVVCQELGCGNAVAVLHSAYFGQGVGLIWLDDVQCSGNESSILNCGHLGAGTHNCIHYEDVSVICEEIVPLPPPSPPVRLVGSNRTCSGRVEVYLHGYWGTVCDDMWGLTQAQVVCQELGCGNAVTALNRAQFGRGIGPIWLDDVQCSGNESSILNCGHLGAGTHNCGHYEDVSVICEGSVPPPPLPTPPVRLVDSNSTCSGRVEVYLHGHWGTVCDDRWGLTEAQVVCQELGCGRALSAPRYAHFGQGDGLIWLDDVQCSGNESSILNCGHLGAGTHNCGHYEDASVVCEVATTLAPTVPTPTVRLVGSESTCAGRVEVYFNDQWGTVCDDYWGLTQAQVVCQELGCGSVVAALHGAQFGEGVGPIWLDNVQCSGNESTIINCGHLGAGTHNCGHYEDVSVVCEEIVQPPAPSPPVRLVDSNRTCSGRVEVYLHGHWGTVCDDRWGLTEAQVVCQELGCGSAVAVLHRAQFGQGVGPIWLDDVQCSGNESSILNCGHLGAGTHNCIHYEDVSVVCEGSVPPPPLPTPPVRLVDSNSTCSGRVEVYLHGHWGTVCDDRWGLTDAQVVCQELGCGRALSAPRYAHFGQGEGLIWLDDVQCSGNESSILNCGHLGAGTHNCRHYEDASVVCEVPTPTVRLVGSESTCAGRVEVYFNDQWGTVCDDYWGLTQAQVVCQELGCGSVVAALHGAQFGQGVGPIWLDDVQCSGNESSIINCGHLGAGTHNCGHYEDVSVVCGEIVPTPPPPSPPVRLVDSNRTCSGRVEVYLHGHWGTVCDDRWGLTEAQVVCQEVGCGRALAVLHSAQFGQGVGPIWLDDVQCSGNESSILNCGHRGAGTHNCIHYEDVSVVCEEIVPTPPPPSPPVRLVDSNRTCSGRVEVYLHGHWGTVCDDRWGLTEAQVVCQEVGCGRALAVLHSAQFGQGVGPIWLDDVQCSGNESSILNCGHRGAGTHNCIHYEDVSVVCEEIVPTPPPPSPPVRLVDSNRTCSGRVEVYLHGHWGTVCDDRWGLTEAQVVCQEVGCGRALAVLHSAQFGQGVGPIWLDDVQCSGNESSILNCGHRGAGTHNCIHYEDVSVVCEEIVPTPPPPSPPVRLADSNRTCSGRVEVYLHGHWGTVCDDQWGLTEAQVVCQEVGCGRALSAPRYAHFGQGNGPIWLDNVQCSGDESSILNCGHQGAGTHNCVHYEDASVVCEDISDEEDLLQTTELVCSRNTIEIGVTLGSLLSSGLNAVSGHLAAPYCSIYRVQGNTLWYQVRRQAGSCGTTLMTNDTHAIYSNSLFFYPPSNGSLVVPEIIPFSCAYPLETETSLTDEVSQQLPQNGGLMGSGSQATAQMRLFRDSGFVNSYPEGPVTLSVGSPMYVGVFVDESDSSFVVVLEECYSTHSSNPDDRLRYYLIHNKCSAAPRFVSVVENGMSLRARFSALVFPLYGDNSGIYLHCRVRLCDNRTESCVPVCRRRAKRSVSNAAPLDTVSFGPIHWE